MESKRFVCIQDNGSCEGCEVWNESADECGMAYIIDGCMKKGSIITVSVEEPETKGEDNEHARNKTSV